MKNQLYYPQTGCSRLVGNTMFINWCSSTFEFPRSPARSRVQTRYSPPWFSGCVGQYEQMVKFPLGGCACSPKHTSPSRTDAGSLVKSPSGWIVSFLVLFKQGYWRKIVRICKKWSWSQISEAKASQNLGSDWQQKTFSEALISPGEKIIGTELSMVHSDSSTIVIENPLFFSGVRNWINWVKWTLLGVGLFTANLWFGNLFFVCQLPIPPFFVRNLGWQKYSMRIALSVSYMGI